MLPPAQGGGEMVSPSQAIERDREGYEKVQLDARRYKRFEER